MSGISVLKRDTNCSNGDAELVRLFSDLAEGRIEALEGVLARSADQLYGLALWRTASSTDAEDAVQDVFVRLARTGPRLAGVKNPRAYLFRMVRNAAMDIVSRRREAPLDESAPNLVVVAGVEDRIDSERASTMILKLPPKQREVIYLHHLEGLSFREISEICGIPLFTAASRHRLAIQKLRRLMGVKP